jgi:hypothetical protein
MGKIKEPLPVKLIASMIYQNGEILLRAKDKLTERLGNIDYESRAIPFDFTTYYEEEMGKNLKRQFISFEPLIQMEELPQIKIFTNQLEKDLLLLDREKRTINIDPGYLAPEKLVLATTKNFAHRPYLGNRIYAELTYLFRSGSFQTLEWTYPDYKSSQSVNMFNEIRNRYVKQLKESEKDIETGKNTNKKEDIS